MKMAFRKAALFASTLATGVSAIKKHVEIDAMKHDIQQIHQGNFDGVLSTALPLTVSSVWYFKGSNKADASFLDTYNELAKMNKKMLKILAVDCDDNKKLCDRVGAQTTDGAYVRIYPQSPQPHFEFQGEKTVEGINKLLKKMMGDKITSFSSAEEFTSFKAKNPTKTKIVLFSDKKKAPIMLKGLSTDSVFARTVDFGFVGEVGKGGPGDAIAEAAGKNAKKPPVLMMISKGKTTWYGTKKNSDMSFLAIHEWINVNSESGMGDKVKDASGEEAPEVEVEVERVREMHAKTANELCFKQKNICAIYLQEGDKLDDKAADKIQSFESAFEPKSDRGVRFSWMWMDVNLQKEFKEVLIAQEAKEAEKQGRDPEAFKYPTVVMVKPPRKKREEKFLSYLRMGEGVAVSKDAVKAMVEKVSGGATYSRGDVPKMIVKPAAKKEAKKGKEEL